MAYAAVISLKRTINGLLNSPYISSFSSPEFLEFAFKSTTSLQQVLERPDDGSRRKKNLNGLDTQIKETVHEIENLLESHVSNHFLSEPKANGEEELRREMKSLMDNMKKEEDEYATQLEYSSPEEEEEDSSTVPSHTDFGVKMVGLSNEFNHFKTKLLKRNRPDEFAVFSFIGMAGSGRSMIAKALFEQFTINEQLLECGAMVTIGPMYQLKDIFLAILSQMNGSEFPIPEGDEEALRGILYSSLKGRKYMIVIDDMWETCLWDDLIRSFPLQNNGSLILITTSFDDVAQYVDSCRIFQILDQDEDRTWDLLSVAIFGVESPCPQEFEESGKMIAKNCEGRRVSIMKTILFLLKAEETPESWKEIAADTEHSIFMVADELLEVNKIVQDLQLMSSFCLGNNQRIRAIRMVVAALNSGLSLNALEQYRIHMFPDYTMPKIEFMSVLGMAGIGKTTLAKEIFKDRSILDHFDHRVWLTLGPKYQPQEILADILVQTYPNIDKTSMEEDEAFANELCSKLSNKRFLIVLDDVWQSEALQRVEELFKKFNAKVLVTTRLAYVARFRPIYKNIVRMRLLNKEESWNLLCQKVFGEGSCPIALEGAGKRISELCDGLPLLILMVADHLSKSEKTIEYWNKVADQNRNEVFSYAHSEISKALVPSYERLSQKLKPCFLYLGVFLRSYEIAYSKLIMLWDSDGFLEAKPSENVEDQATKCIGELVNKSVVMECHTSSYFDIGACRLHSIFWHLSNSEAAKSNFYLAMDTVADVSMEGLEGQRRICIRNNTLLGVKDVQDSTKSMSAAHALLCTGSHHKYPVPICFGLRLLRVMDALTVRLYEFPVELVDLIHLRYLALNCSGKIPSSISNLCCLMYLIVSQHLCIKSCEDLTYLPKEIWDMKELKHLHVTGRNLTNPQSGTFLPNLSTLLDLSAESCTDEVFKGTPNLLRLGIQIELDPDGGFPNPLDCLDRSSRLSKLESLECVVVNPEFGVEVVAPTIPVFPLGLKKLSLSGLGYPWEYMTVIGELQKLEVLELRCYAFQGTTWIAEAYSFGEVQYLLLEDIDLVKWELERFSFKNLECLVIKHCYQLELLPHNLSSTVGKIEVFDCNPFAMTWSEGMKVVDLNNKHISRAFLEVESHASWDARKVI